MRPINYYYLALLSAILLINNGCSNEDQTSGFNSRPLIINAPPPPVAAPETPTPAARLVARAGLDLQVLLPKDFCLLQGGYSTFNITNSADNNYIWKQISGPSSVTIENPTSLRTQVSKLGKGIYVFEITITNINGLTATDQVTVTVGQMSTNPKVLILKNLKWIFPWYNAIEIKDFNLLIGKSVFKIYVQRENNLQWQEVTLYDENSKDTKYEYFIETRPDGAGIYTFGSLYIFYYGIDTADMPSVKIEYIELD